jgi:hypothetical protein
MVWAMPAKHHIYLVPGFFGFINLGELIYFGHAYDYLKAELARRRVDAEVTIVLSHPTASIRTRTADLLKAVQETRPGTTAPSTSWATRRRAGLAAVRQPGAQLAEGLEQEPFAKRVRTVVTVSTPHAGTPLATFFMGLFGQQLLKLLSLFTVYVLRFGRLPLRVAFRFGHVLARADDNLGWKPTLLDQLYDQLLGDFSSERRDAVAKFLSDVGNDTSLIPQLTPEGIDLFNASTVDRPGVRYGSVVTPGTAAVVPHADVAGLDPYAQHDAHHLRARVWTDAADAADVDSAAHAGADGGAGAGLRGAAGAHGV